MATTGIVAKEIEILCVQPCYSANEVRQRVPIVKPLDPPLMPEVENVNLISKVPPPSALSGGGATVEILGTLQRAASGWDSEGKEARI